MFVSTQNLDRFTMAGDPRTPPPVYLIKPASVFDRAHFRADLDGEGLRLPGVDEMFTEARAFATAMGGDDVPTLLTLIDQAEADELAPGTPDAATWQRFAQSLFDHWPPYQALVAARSKWMRLSPLHAARRFLKGWENGPAPFRLGADGLAPVDLLGLLPEADLLAIGTRAIEIMRPSEGQEKNFASPPPSATGHTASPAGGTVSAAKAGSSRKRSSTKTRA